MGGLVPDRRENLTCATRLVVFAPQEESNLRHKVSNMNDRQGPSQVV